MEPDLVFPFESPREEEDGDRRFIFRESDLSRHIEGEDEGKVAPQANGSKKVEEMLFNDNQLRLALQMVKTLPHLKDIH